LAQEVRALTDAGGVTAAVNSARGGEGETLSTVADGGRFATLTGSATVPERGVTIADVYVRADGEQRAGGATVLTRSRRTRFAKGAQLAIVEPAGVRR
jgi:hypothetical protein